MAKAVSLNHGTKYMNSLQFVSFFADCKEHHHVCFQFYSIYLFVFEYFPTHNYLQPPQNALTIRATQNDEARTAKNTCYFLSMAPGCSKTAARRTLEHREEK